MIKVSVIVPVYNVEKYLDRCLESILNQTLNDIEIICIEDCSTDNSKTILEKYKNYPNFKIILNSKNIGLSDSRNIGLAQATGEYISFIDSDDYIDKNFYETLYNCAVKNNADIACAGIVRENEKKKNLLFNYKQVELTKDIKEKYLLAKSPKYNFVWNKIYKKEMLISNNIKFISGMIYEDLCFTPDVLEKSDFLVVCPNTNYHYWKRKDSLIKKDSDKSRADKLLGTEYIRKKCIKYAINTNIKNELLYKEQITFFKIPIIKKKIYRATKKLYLFNIIPFIEIRRSV